MKSGLMRFIYLNLSEALTRMIALRLWFRHKKVRWRVGFGEIVREIISPLPLLGARRFCERLFEDDAFVYFYLRGIEGIYQYPKALPLTDLAGVLTEQFRPSGWHYYEIPQTAVEPGDTVVDCGAGEGVFAFKNRAIANHIYAIEPLPDFVRSLLILFVGDSRVTVRWMAASDKRSRVYLKEDSVGSRCIGETPQMGAVSVNAVPLDDLFAKKDIRVDYIKMDVEGFEERILAGARETIRRYKPKLAITCYHRENDYRRMVSLVQEVAPDYEYLVKGITGPDGRPVMLHMWHRRER